MTNEKQEELDAVKSYILEIKESDLFINLTEEDKIEIIEEYGSLETYVNKLVQDVYDCFSKCSVL
jgi:hypothetical protein